MFIIDDRACVSKSFSASIWSKIEIFPVDNKYLLDGMKAPSFATFGNIIRKELTDSIEQIFLGFLTEDDGLDDDEFEEGFYIDLF